MDLFPWNLTPNVILVTFIPKLVQTQLGKTGVKNLKQLDKTREQQYKSDHSRNGSNSFGDSFLDIQHRRGWTDGCEFHIHNVIQNFLHCLLPCNEKWKQTLVTILFAVSWERWCDFISQIKKITLARTEKREVFSFMLAVSIETDWLRGEFVLLLLCNILAKLGYCCWPILAILARWKTSVYLEIHSEDL